MASETLSLFPSPVCSIPPKSCLRQAEDVHMRRNTPSPVLSSKPYPSGKLRGLALQLTPRVSKSTSGQSPESDARPSFSSPASTRSLDNSMMSASPQLEAAQAAAGTRRRPAVAIRKVSIDTTSSETRSNLSGPTLVRSNSGSSAQQKNRVATHQVGVSRIRSKSATVAAAILPDRKPLSTEFRA